MHTCVRLDTLTTSRAVVVSDLILLLAGGGDAGGGGERGREAHLAGDPELRAGPHRAPPGRSRGASAPARAPLAGVARARPRSPGSFGGPGSLVTPGAGQPEEVAQQARPVRRDPRRPNRGLRVETARDHLGVDRGARVALGGAAEESIREHELREEHIGEEVAAAEEDGCHVYIGMAGVAAALPGVLASMTPKPVIGVPVGSKVPYDSLLSIVQMPPGMPVATVGVDRGDNAALLALQIIGINNPAIAAAVVEYREMRTNAVIADDQALQEERSA